MFSIGFLLNCVKRHHFFPSTALLLHCIMVLRISYESYVRNINDMKIFIEHYITLQIYFIGGSDIS